MSAGERVDVLERDARTIYDVACIREGSPNATREDVDFKALALRHFNNIGAVAELVAADREYDEAMAAWETLDTRRSLGDYEDSRDYEGPVARRRQDARVRRLRAIAALQVTP